MENIPRQCSLLDKNITMFLVLLLKKKSPIVPAQYLNQGSHHHSDTRMSTATIARLEEKIESYIALLDDVQNEEGKLKAPPDENDPKYHWKCGRSEIKLLEILQPLIFNHWVKILKLTPKASWKHACTLIEKIQGYRDRMNGVAKKKVTAAVWEDYSFLMCDVVDFPKEKKLDKDQEADLFIFDDDEEEEEEITYKRIRPSPPSPCCGHPRVDPTLLHSFLFDD